MLKETDRRRQTTDKVLLVSPDHFGFNPQTFADNLFQTQLDLPPEQIRAQARVEFGNMVGALQTAGIETFIAPAPKAQEPTYDEMFPNNVYSFHSIDGRNVMVLHPMRHRNRQLERQPEAVLKALKGTGTRYDILDLSYFEAQQKALEGTGSVVLDRVNKVAFAALSPRTDKEVLDVFCQELGYEPVVFTATGKGNEPVYHTNVLMSIGEKFAVVCLEAIANPKAVEAKLKDLDKKIIPISIAQMGRYAGNVLEIGTDRRRILMSTAARKAFTPQQFGQLSEYASPLVVNIKVIETVGGGSARCTFCEVFP